MNEERTPANGREGRWRRWLLVVSLGLNLLVVGLVIGAVLRGGPHGGPAGRIDLTVGPLLRALEAEDRRSIRAGLREAQPFDRGARAAMRRDMGDMLAVLRAERFDADRMRGIMQRQYDRLQSVQGAVADQFVVHVAAMPRADRLALAARFEEELGRSFKPGARDRE
ncbi:MAG: periplasmic heavy metal sensor [Alphaproteobacteria bacterium]|jgi:uncharacterized membrane protein|nr:periplasmic heavy metal sensor [Alphaproteobacteria bacterium]